VYGCGRWANRSHIPILSRLEGAQVVALCDIDPEALRATAERAGVAPDHTYLDGHEMLAQEPIDALFSTVRPEHRNKTGVEVDAARRGIHVFSEKPQALSMAVAASIDRAILEAGVLSTVGFRERYRPLFRQARERLAAERERGREIVHVRFQSVGSLPPPAQGDGRRQAWYGGPALSWGVHALDYVRYLTGLEVTQAQAYYHARPQYGMELSQSFNLRLSNGATLSLLFVRALSPGAGETFVTGTAFTFYHEGGSLSLYRHDRETWSMRVDGAEAGWETYDPWLEQSRRFVEAVRSGDGSLLLNDYHDGLYTLGAFLAGWASAKRAGACIDVGAFMQGELGN
jgi:predicted dehydrogenase